MGVILNFLPYIAVPLSIAVMVVPLYIAWRALMAIERIAEATERIERNTRGRAP